MITYIASQKELKNGLNDIANTATTFVGPDIKSVLEYAARCIDIRQDQKLFTPLAIHIYKVVIKNINDVTNAMINGDKMGLDLEIIDELLIDSKTKYLK